VLLENEQMVRDFVRTDLSALRSAMLGVCIPPQSQASRFVASQLVTVPSVPVAEDDGLVPLPSYEMSWGRTGWCAAWLSARTNDFA
jgi:hypothetical protein